MLGQLAATSSGTYKINLNSAGVAAVQQWINDPSKNFGIIIKDYAVTKAVEFAQAKHPPLLSVRNWLSTTPIRQ